MTHRPVFLFLPHGGRKRVVGEHVDFRRHTEREGTLERAGVGMGVGVDQARQERLARAIHDGTVVRQGDVRAGGRDDAVLDQHRGALNGANAVEEAGPDNRERL